MRRGYISTTDRAGLLLVSGDVSNKPKMLLIPLGDPPSSPLHGSHRVGVLGRAKVKPTVFFPLPPFLHLPMSGTESEEASRRAYYKSLILAFTTQFNDNHQEEERCRREARARKAGRWETRRTSTVTVEPPEITIRAERPPDSYGTKKVDIDVQYSAEGGDPRIPGAPPSSWSTSQTGLAQIIVETGRTLSSRFGDYGDYRTNHFVQFRHGSSYYFKSET